MSIENQPIDQFHSLGAGPGRVAGPGSLPQAQAPGPLAETVQDKIEQCWRQGNTISETRLAVHRATGTKPGFEQVRRTFADLSHQFAEAAA
jgi:hypothetical protein